jgi:two-component system phosphate regulon sensor histidine kinase PhoR
MRNRKGKSLKSSKSALKAINYEIKRLSSILSDLSLITSKAWELKNRIVYEKVSLKNLISKVVQRSKALAFRKNISVTSKDISDITIIGDKNYLEKMVMNLVKNSIIYGNKDGHTKISTTESKGFVTINVADDGIGINKEDLPRVFERFYRAKKSLHADKDSIGLGLAIVKWVAEIHGGRVSVKNSKNKGSIFSVSLPIKAKKK